MPLLKLQDPTLTSEKVTDEAAALFVGELTEKSIEELEGATIITGLHEILGRVIAIIPFAGLAILLYPFEKDSVLCYKLS